MDAEALSLALQQQSQIDEEPLFEILPPSPDSPGSEESQYPTPVACRSFAGPREHLRRNNHHAGAGLRNLGNTCFLNAVLQCFTYTPPLVRYLNDSEHTCANEGFCAFCALREHVNLALSLPGGVIEPSKLVDNLSNISASFQRWEQEDAHEYMHCFLEALHKSVLCSKSSNLGILLQGESFVKKLFGGCLRSQIKCVDCLHCSDTFEPLIDLSLEIDNSDSITKALECFTTVETVDCDGKYKCQNCKHGTSVLKQLTIHRPPQILLIQLKRFINNGYTGEKICNGVAYSPIIDLKPFVSNADEVEGDLKYELYAVLVHSGWTMDSGHYYSFVQTSPGIWHELDDSQVVAVDEKTVLEQQAYILLYYQQGSSWFPGRVEEVQKQISIESPNSVLEESSITDYSDSVAERESDISVPFQERENGMDAVVNDLMEMLPDPKQYKVSEVNKLSSSTFNSERTPIEISEVNKILSPTMNNQSTPIELLEADKLSSPTMNSQGPPVCSSSSDESGIEKVPKSKVDKMLSEADKLSSPRLNSQSTLVSSRSLAGQRATLEKSAHKPTSDVRHAETNFGTVDKSHIQFQQQSTPNSINRVLSIMPGKRRACFMQCIQSSNNNFQAPSGANSPVSSLNSSKKRNSSSEGSLNSKRSKMNMNGEVTATGRRRVKSESPRGREQDSSRAVCSSTGGNECSFPILPTEDDPYSFGFEIEQMPKYVPKTESKKTRSPNGNI